MEDKLRDSDNQDNNISEPDVEIVEMDSKLVENYDFTDENVLINKGEADEKKDSLGIHILKEVWSYVKLVLIALVLALFISNFIIINATVPTGSMENTIMTGSRIIGLRLSYIFGEPERGDIVVFKYPLDESINYVKRVIGLPGEKVEISEGKIYIYNSKGQLVEGPLEEDYLKETWVNGNDGYVFEVPEDSYLMLGDNRNYSADARSWMEYYKNNPDKYGNDPDIIYVKKDKILGKVFFCYWHKGIKLDWLDNENVNY